MSHDFTLTNGFDIALSGDQIKFIRTVLNESQEAFGKRLAVSQPVIYRLEKNREQKVTGPEVILISAIARAFSIPVPDSLIRRAPSDQAEQA